MAKGVAPVMLCLILSISQFALIQCFTGPMTVTPHGASSSSRPSGPSFNFKDYLNVSSDHPIEITSLGFPDGYPSNMELETLITATYGSVIRVEFEHFVVENHGSCGYDYLQFRDGMDSSAPLLAQLCGDEIPSPVVSSGNYLWMFFYSDRSVTYDGYKARVTASANCLSLPNIANLTTTEQFSVPAGTVVSVVCEAGYTLSGDSEITCDSGTTFTYENEPVCNRDAEVVYCWNKIKKTKLEGTEMAVVYGAEEALQVANCLGYTAYSCHKNNPEKKGCYLYPVANGTSSQKKWHTYEYGPCEDQ